MFRTKKDVDRHVQEVLRKIQNEHERNKRCYNIAQQYYKVRDYESAKHYLSLYLSVKEDSPLAYKLQGQIYEALNDKIRALNAYRTSLEIEGNQPELVLKMCKLLCETDIAIDSDRAHYWCERACNMFPHDPVVFRLKEKLLKIGGTSNTKAFEELINSEVKARPNDLNVRTRLMKLYLETGRTKAAFQHSLELEASQLFSEEVEWYECFAEVCKTFAEEFPSHLDWQTYCTWVTVMNKVTSLSLYELTSQKKIVDCTQALFSLDQVLFKAANISVPKENGELYNQFIKHMSGQLCLHIATLILKRTKKESSSWKEATNSVCPLLCLALSPPPDTEATWALTLNQSQKHSLERWSYEASYRVSQAGYLLLSLEKEVGDQFPRKIAQMGTGNWREKTYQKVFMTMEQRSDILTSHFVKSKMFSQFSTQIPAHDSGFLKTKNLVPVYEKVRNNLHHLVWLGLEVTKQNKKKLPIDFHTYSFSKLKLTTHNLANMSPETLNQLDLDAFLYAAVLCAKAQLEDEIASGFYSSDRPMTLPADISNLLCTQEQINWWSSACQVNSQQFSTNTNAVTLRQQLQRGLEVIRVNNNHGLDVQLLVKLAQTFTQRAESMIGQGDQAALEARASLYWKAALPLLENMDKNQAFQVSNSKLFQYARKNLSSEEVNTLLEEGRYFIACELMKSDQCERAIEAFKPLRNPYASFNQALIYKKLAAAEISGKAKESITSEMRSKHVILLSKARECLNLTYDRIRIDRKHPLHQTLAEHTAEVETALSRIEPDPDLMNHSEEEAHLSTASVTSITSPVLPNDMSFQSPKVNGRHSSHKQASATPRRHYSDKRYIQHGELVDVSQLLQIQSIHEEIKLMNNKLVMVIDTVNELRRDFNDLRQDVNKSKQPCADDLYIFGDEEEYPEDVLGSQYPPTFVPSYPAPQPNAAATFYPSPPRGVQGTATVTYGAPPSQQSVIPLLPMRVPIDPTLAQNLAFYNSTLPFADPHQLPDFLRQTLPKPVLSQPSLPQVLPPAPVNVVITTSDTLPTGPPPVQPTLSVTIPAQHRLGTLPTPSNVTTPTSNPPHKFQIAMPASAMVPNIEKSPILANSEVVDSEDENEVGYDPMPDFAPIVPLPKEVAVKTGEENEDTLFENKAKLFRYVDKEWKERGVGIVKILKNKTTNKARLLMRRDQVHKICANHLLTSDMELTMMKNSDRALLWVANDFSEEIVQLEKFCIKFKTPEEALRFQDVFNDSKVKYGQSPTKPKVETEPEKKSSSEHSLKDDSAKINIGGFTFTDTPKLKLLEAKEKRSEEEEKQKDSQVAPSPFAAFSFQPQKSAHNENSSSSGVLKQPTLFAGLNSTQNKHFLFTENNASQFSVTPKVPNDNDWKPTLNSSDAVPISNSKEIKSILKEPVITDTIVNNSKLSSTKHVLFQDDSSTDQVPTLASLLSSSETPVLDFATLSKRNENETPAFTSDGSKSSGFVGAGSTVFGSTSNRTRNDSEGENAEEFVPNAEFKPVIPLPELVEVKSGEEGEEVLFNERAKLMRYDPDAKEWKERGLGQMKILKTFETGVSRFLMRREQVFKVCCNHRIIHSLELKVSSSSEKAWTWYAVDYADGEPKNELFAIRFKTVDLAKKFKEVVDNVQRQQQLREEGSSKRSCPDSVQDVAVSPAQTPRGRSGSDATKSSDNRPKSGSWECKACYTVNGGKDYSCVSCDSRKEKPKSPGPQTPEKALPLSELFKPKAGSWMCEGCFVRNDAGVVVCPACSTVKPGHQQPTEPLKKQDSSTPFSFGINPISEVSNVKANSTTPLSELFKPSAGSWECSGCFVRNNADVTVCPACSTPKPGHDKPALAQSSTPFSFGIMPTTETVSNTTNYTPLTELFKPSVGSWECNGCLVRNNADITVCPACSTPKPGHENDNQAQKPSESFSFSAGSNLQKSGFNFGTDSFKSSPASSFTFGIPTSQTDKVETQAPKPFSFKPAAAFENNSGNNNTASSGFSFGQSATKSVSPFTLPPSKSEVVPSKADSTSSGENQTGGNLFGFGTPTQFSSFSFGNNLQSSETGDNFAFGKGSNFEFSFSGVKSGKSPQSGPKSPGTGHESDSEPEDLAEEEGDHIIFQPVVPLPDKIEVTTGEENEVVCYSQRSRLYRFAQGEWKERGTGDIKILQHNDTRKIRLLMRREPIMKICLNHFLSSELIFTQKDDRSWLWFAPDFADGQLSNEQFCVRFKTPEIAAEFKKAIESAQGELETARESLDGQQSTTKPEQNCVTKLTTNDVEVVYEVKVSEELRQKALGLQLPPNFYSYLDREPCKGCVGCEPDSEEEELSKIQRKDLSAKSTTASSESLLTTTTTTAVSQPFTFSVNTTSTPLSGFKLTSTATPASPSTAQSTFSFSLNSENAKPSIFGGFNSQTTSTPQSTSIFGGGSAAPSPKPALLFGSIGSPAQTATTLSFGSTSQSNDKNKTSQSLFASPTGNVFGGSPASVFGTPNQNMFGGSGVFNTPNSTMTPQGTPSEQSPGSTTEVITSSPKGSFLSSFSSAQTTVFGGSATPMPLKSLFGGTSEAATTENSTGPAFLFKSTTTFSDLAANSNQTPFSLDKQPSGNFSWVGAGSTIFGGQSTPKSTKSSTKEEGSGDESGDEETVENTHDPVFEPIVPLPDIIEVRTGEEEEVKEFCEKAKFYRYDVDTKEWKERGVGDMKILRHIETSTYRLLLRRIQVHKVVCNQLISESLELQPLSNSDKAFCWAAMNMAEEYSEPQLEKVAVRFKDSEVAYKFKDKVEECIASVKARKKKFVPETDSSAELLEPSVILEEVSEEDGNEAEGEEYEVLDYPDGEFMFEKRATLSIKENQSWERLNQGDLCIIFNNDMHMGNVVFKPDSGEELLISVASESQAQIVNDKTVVWLGQDINQYDQDEYTGEDQQEFKAEFSSPQAAEEFLTTLNEAMEMSQTYDYIESGNEN